MGILGQSKYDLRGIYSEVKTEGGRKSQEIFEQGIRRYQLLWKKRQKLRFIYCCKAEREPRLIMSKHIRHVPRLCFTAPNRWYTWYSDF
jgi:hypothetical protein